MTTLMKSEGIASEHELVLELAQFRHPNRERIIELVGQKLDWAQVLGHLVYNRTAGIAYHVLRQADAPFFNREFETGLFLIHEIQAVRTRSHKQAIVQIAESMNESGLPYAFLKGSILANAVYPPGCRISSDIDILLRGEDLTACGNVLKSLDFIQGNYDENNKTVIPASRREIINHRLNYGEVVPYRKAISEPGLNLIEIDVNFSLDWVAHGSEQAVSDFVEQAEDYYIDQQRVRSLPKEYFLAHLCVHLYKEAAVHTFVEWQRDLGLYKFVDIYAFLTDPNIRLDWDKLVWILKTHRIAEQCYFAFEYTRTFFPALNDHIEFIQLMRTIKPQDSGYLDCVVDASNPNIVYRWNKNLIARFFDMKRYLCLERITI